ncbi:hypothetical protein MLD38_031658 [Melastoma candidum]|uniref:Uncharacterized protein n=1 Tax=Melastoma candidum TaxID=119954 RepID=A0ACB9MQ68_9MYRT|nr:hypothetical protein MLD38_031658 [Melastoma candidum]
MLKMAATLGGQAVGIPSFSSSPSKSCYARPRNPISNLPMMAYRSEYTCRLIVACPAIQESSTSALATSEIKEAKAATPEEAAAPEGAAQPKPKPKPAAKALARPFPQLMEEEIIPPLLEILQTQKDILDFELSFQENRLEGSFLKKGKKYSFWAFFHNDDLTGPKGFSLSSYGSDVSTVEPFLMDEKKPTAKLVVFWVEKHLAAQGIIPVWDE